MKYLKSTFAAKMSIVVLKHFTHHQNPFVHLVHFKHHNYASNCKQEVGLYMT